MEKEDLAAALLAPVQNSRVGHHHHHHHHHHRNNRPNHYPLDPE
jgi:hypothetical protein